MTMVTTMRVAWAVPLAMMIGMAAGCGDASADVKPKAGPSGVEAQQAPATDGAAAAPDPTATGGGAEPTDAGAGAAAAPAAPPREEKKSYLGRSLQKAEDVRDLAAEHDKALRDVIGQ